MAKKKKSVSRQKIKTPRKARTTPNRYNIFQNELSAYLVETGGKKGDYRKYVKLYKHVDPSVPMKRMRDYLPGLIKKFSGEPIIVSTIDYAVSVPFYNAKGEFALPKYSDVVLEVRFDDTVPSVDGGFKFEWTGTQIEFSSWFSGDVMAYFRNNYNDSPPAEFRLKDVDGKVVSYQIEVGAGIVGTPGYVPVAGGLVVRDKAARAAGQNQGQATGNSDTVVFMGQQTELIKQWREVGYSNEEIRAKIKQLEENFYGKRTK